MALATIQAAAARLCTDAEARRRLRDEPDAFASEWGLEVQELDWLREIAAGFEHFSRSLWNKRANEAEGSLPQTRKALGEGYTPLFRKFADAVSVAANPMLDALAFLEWLSASPETPVAIRDIALFEGAGLQFRLGNRRLKIGLFRFRDKSAGLPPVMLAIWHRRFLNGEVNVRFFWLRGRR